MEGSARGILGEDEGITGTGTPTFSFRRVWTVCLDDDDVLNMPFGERMATQAPLIRHPFTII